MPAQFAKGFQEAQRVTLVIIFAADHVHGNEDVAVVMHELIGEAQDIFGIGQETQDGQLKAHRHSRGERILLRQPLTNNIGHCAWWYGIAIGVAKTGDSDLRLEIGDAFGPKRPHVAVQGLCLEPGIVGERVEACPMRAKELIAALIRLVEADAVHPAGLFLVTKLFEALVLALLTVAQRVIFMSGDIAKQQVVRRTAELVATIRHAVFDSNLGVVAVATIALSQRHFVPPLREVRA